MEESGRKICIICIWRVVEELELLQNLISNSGQGSRSFEDPNQERIPKENLVQTLGAEQTAAELLSAKLYAKLSKSQVRYQSG